MQNYLEMKLPAHSENEGVARGAVAAFVLCLDPTIDQLNDIKTAVSEAVTNAIVHGYSDSPEGIININAKLCDREVTVSVEDFGRGIEDIEQARQPFFTTATSEERSGMGFTVMETFMDSLEIVSKKGSGTTVILKKGF